MCVTTAIEIRLLVCGVIRQDVCLHSVTVQTEQKQFIKQVIEHITEKNALDKTKSTTTITAHSFIKVNYDVESGGKTDTLNSGKAN